MPKRLRILLRFDRWLLGALCRLANESICDVMQQASRNDDAVAGMVGAIQVGNRWGQNPRAITDSHLISSLIFSMRNVL